MAKRFLGRTGTGAARPAGGVHPNVHRTSSGRVYQRSRTTGGEDRLRQRGHDRETATCAPNPRRPGRRSRSTTGCTARASAVITRSVENVSGDNYRRSSTRCGVRAVPELLKRLQADTEGVINSPRVGSCPGVTCRGPPYISALTARRLPERIAMTDAFRPQPVRPPPCSRPAVLGRRRVRYRIGFPCRSPAPSARDNDQQTGEALAVDELNARAASRAKVECYSATPRSASGGRPRRRR